MKTLRFFGIQIKVAFCIDRVKRMTFDIPDWADDCYVHNSDTKDAVIRYFKGGTPHFIDLPKCKKADCVSVSKLYNKDRTCYNTDRKIVVDVYL